MGLTKTDFTLFPSLTAIIAADLRVDTRAETESGDRYLISASDLGSGSLMSNGLYANPLLSGSSATLTTADLINSSASVSTGDTIETSGFTTGGDGGGAQWKSTGNVITASQTPALTGGGTLSNANGNEFTLVPSDSFVFTAFGGSSADSALELAAALAFSASSGAWLVGDGTEYGLAGSNSIPANARMKDIRFKQLDPLASTSTRTLTSSGNNLMLYRVSINTGDEPTAGVLADGFAGLYVTGGTGSRFVDIDVTGNCSGHGIGIFNASKFQLVRPYVHDITYSKVVSDDTLEGIRLQGCSDFQVYMPEIGNLHGDFGTGDTTRYTRGLAITGCERYSIGQPNIYDVDQGIDQSGNVGNGNKNFSITGGNVSRAFSWGYKFASSSSSGGISNCIATDTGYAGFVASGGSLSGSVVTSNLDFVGCKSINAGYNGEWAANNPSGFLVLAGSVDALRPYGIKFNNCKAIDEQTVKTMVYGFKNQVAGQDEKLNEAIDCESIGHTVSAYDGIHFPNVLGYITTSFTLATGSTTPINFNASSPDTSSMRQGTDFTVRKSGEYYCAANVAFDANATGTRTVRITLNGSLLPKSEVAVDASATGVTQVETSSTFYANAGDNVSVAAQQDSGGNLDVLSSGTSVKLNKI